MSQKELLAKVERFARKELWREGSHDFWHVWRVRRLAERLAKGSRADALLVSVAALLHDVEDWKHSGDAESGPRKVEAWLKRQGFGAERSAKAAQIIREVTFKGAGVPTKPSSLEACLVQDADRLDALGAIGIARTFAYGGAKGRALYVPGEKPVLHASFAKYRKAKGHSLNHFYEKLFLLKDRMNTPQARKLAAARHRLMQRYVKAFLGEWKGKA